MLLSLGGDLFIALYYGDRQLKSIEVQIKLNVSNQTEVFHFV